MSVVDVSNGTLVGGVPLSDGGFNLLVAPDGARVYVTTASGTLDVIDTRTLKMLDTVSVGASANGLALDQATNTLYVTNPPAGTVYVVDRAGRQVLDSLTKLGHPRNVAFDRTGSTAVVTDETGYVCIVP